MTGSSIARRLTLCLSLAALLSCAAPAHAKTLARCGRGYLEEIDGYLVLHVKGTPYEMGYQHGALLKDHIRENVHYLFEVKGKDVELEFFGLKFTAKNLISRIVELQRPHLPARFIEELEGIAAGAGLSFEDAAAANFIPELFHCSGFAIMNGATKDGTLYHGRILDYAVDWKLQEHAVLTIAEPENGHAFVNVTYAGFIGSVTGMNARHVSIGEMGGRGLGHWDGAPMAFLVRRVLEEADTLDEALEIFEKSERTCEYYYVIADGKDNRAAGLAAHWNEFEVVRPGAAHPQLPEPVEDCVLLSAGERYSELVRRVKETRGEFDAESARRLMDRPVAMKSNLHSVLFEPRGQKLWVANASADGQPAATQKYREFHLTELLKRAADLQAPEIRYPRVEAATAGE